jgi:hypothetical protein
MKFQRKKQLILIACTTLGLTYGLLEQSSMREDWALRYAERLGNPKGFPAFTMELMPIAFAIIGFLVGIFLSRLLTRKQGDKDDENAN